MKITVNRIPPEGLDLNEQIAHEALELDTEMVQATGPLDVRARVSKITNVVQVEVNLSGGLTLTCSRCLKKVHTDIQKRFTLTYPVDSGVEEINLDPDIRQEIMLDYPINPLCKPECKGLCPRCGRDLNEGECDC